MLCFRGPALSHRLRAIFAINAIVLTWSFPSLIHAAEPVDEIIGKWKFTAALDYVEPSSLDEKDAQRLIGRIMTIRRTGARFGDQVCGAPLLKAERVEPDLYLQREAGINASKLGLPNPVTVVDISCTQVFIKKPDRAVIFWKGFFFEATRVGR